MDTLKIRVYALAQNRTALGIMHAYLLSHPETSLQEMQAAFPESLNPDNGQKTIFKTIGEILKQLEKIAWNGYFTNDDCLLKFKDGTVAAVVSMWSEKNLKNLIEKAEEYDIWVASEEETNKSFCKKRGFYLICQNNNVANSSNKSHQRYDEHSLNFLQRIDENYFENIKSHLTENTVEYDLNLIHYNFEKDVDTVTVYADGKVTFIHKDKDVIKSMALGVLKGYVENLYRYYEFRYWDLDDGMPEDIAADCSIAQLKEYLTGYVKDSTELWDCADVSDRMYKIMGILDSEPKKGCYWGWLMDAFENYMYYLKSYAAQHELWGESYIPEDASGYILEAQKLGRAHLPEEEEFEPWWSEEEEEEQW